MGTGIRAEIGTSRSGGSGQAPRGSARADTAISRPRPGGSSGRRRDRGDKAGQRGRARQAAGRDPAVPAHRCPPVPDEALWCRTTRALREDEPLSAFVVAEPPAVPNHGVKAEPGESPYPAALHSDIQLLPQQAGMAAILATAVVNSECWGHAGRDTQGGTHREGHAGRDTRHRDPARAPQPVTQAMSLSLALHRGRVPV